MGAPATSTSSHPRHRNDNLPTTESAEEELKKMKDDKKERITGMGTLDTYLSLIQQYLAVFMVKNATFFAERCVAEYPDSQEAVYLLALCYYRAGSPRSARQALEKQRTVLVTTGVRDIGISSSNNSNAGSNSRSIQFLSAQCSFDLKDYTRAEDALLRECRASYKQNRSYVSDGGAMGGIVTNANSLDEWILNTTPCPIPNGAAGLALLGDICRYSNRNQRAIKYYKMSLQLDPFLWTSFCALAELGVKEEELSAKTAFGVSPSACASELTAATSSSMNLGRHDHQYPNNLFTNKTPLQPMETPAHHYHQSSNNGAAAATSQYSKHQPMFQRQQNHHSMMAPSSAAAASTSYSVQRHHQHRSVHFAETPNLTPIPVNNSMMHQQLQQENSAVAETPITSHHAHHHDHGMVDQPGDENNFNNPVVLRRAATVASRQYYPPSPETPITSVARSMRYLKGLGTSTTTTSSAARGAVNNSTNEGGAGGVVGARSLFVSSRTSESIASTNRSTVSNNDNASNSTYTNIPSENNNLTENHNDSDTISLEKKPDAHESVALSAANLQSILELLAVAGAAYQCLCQYKCREALQLLQHLPSRQMHTGWVLHQQGRAYLEISDFTSAQRCLECMQAQDPGRVEGLELLSTVYWQLKKEVELAHLAQKCVDWDRLSPEAWCVVGNCFSLQKDHETALSFFARSLQLDPDFTYTHTLSGYEYMANEDFDKATACFRQALRTDERHYNAWYGLGAIYHRQEKFDLAEYHFERAVSIHPCSSVLRCNLGIAQYANGKAYQALDTLQEAFRLDPRNPQARFQRATIYSALHRPEEALQELVKVRDAAPREATVHFAMGKVLKRLGRPEQAMKCFLTAMDLDPKDNQLIKSAMDKLDEPEIEEEAMTAF